MARELRQTEFAHRLEHHEALFAVGTFVEIHEALIQQRTKPVEDILVLDRPPRRIVLTQRLGGREGASAREDRQSPEQPLLARREEVVAPDHRVAEGPLMGRHVARAASEQLQRRAAGRAVEALEQRLRREHLRARCRELECQRQAVETRADGRDCLGVVRAQGEAGIDIRGPIHEQAYGRILGDHVAEGMSDPRRHRERRHGQLALAR